jgi:hypothetical protein
MVETNSAGFTRSIHFTRTRARNGLFGWTITFTLKRSEDDRQIGELVMKGRGKASYTSDAAPQDAFNIKRNFWGTRWLHEGDDEREFGRSGFGLNFKPSFTFRMSERYYLRVKRRWPFRTKKPGDATQTATFSREEVPVMLLQSFAPVSLFSNEVTAPMDGAIATDITDNRTIAGLLVFYQSYIETRNRSSH